MCIVCVYVIVTYYVFALCILSNIYIYNLYIYIHIVHGVHIPKHFPASAQDPKGLT
jgi:hypothetical protein